MCSGMWRVGIKKRIHPHHITKSLLHGREIYSNNLRLHIMNAYSKYRRAAGCWNRHFLAECANLRHPTVLIKSYPISQSLSLNSFPMAAIQQHKTLALSLLSSGIKQQNKTFDNASHWGEILLTKRHILNRWQVIKAFCFNQSWLHE